MPCRNAVVSDGEETGVSMVGSAGVSVWVTSTWSVAPSCGGSNAGDDDGCGDVSGSFPLAIYCDSASFHRKLSDRGRTVVGDTEGNRCVA